jgi:hypothetical protein
MFNYPAISSAARHVGFKGWEVDWSRNRTFSQGKRGHVHNPVFTGNRTTPYAAGRSEGVVPNGSGKREFVGGALLTLVLGVRCIPRPL